MPQATYFSGALSTDRPLPDQVVEYIEFLCDIDTRSLVAEPAAVAVSILRPQYLTVPDGFPRDAIAGLATQSIYRVSLQVDDDIGLSVADVEYPELNEISLQVVIDAILKPHGVNVTGRIEAQGPDGSDDLWCLVVGDDQIVHAYDGTVVYEDEQAEPSKAVHGSDLDALWAAVKAHPLFAFGAIFQAGDFPGNRLPDDFDGHVEENLLCDYGATLINNEYGPYRPPVCDECGAETEPTFESAPGPQHLESCSLHTPGGDSQ